MIAAPKGVVAILTGPDGKVWTTADCFEERSENDLETIVRRKLADNFIRDLCHPLIVEELSRSYATYSLLDNLRRSKGFHVHMHWIGGEEG